MRVIVIGATGTIGQAVVKALSNRHEIVQAGYARGEYQVDIASRDSIMRLYEAVAPFHAVISAAGLARFGSLGALTYDDFQFSFSNKLMGQVNAGLEGFVRAAALEMPRGIRINVVSPPWVRETLEAMGRDGSPGMPAISVAAAYIESFEGKRNGEVLDARTFA